MTPRSWRSVLALSLFCSVAQAASPAASPATPQAAQKAAPSLRRIYRSYTKSYAGLNARANLLQQSTDQLERSASSALLNWDGGHVQYVANVGSVEAATAGYRADLVAKKTAEAERYTRQPGKFARSLGAKERPIVIDQDAIDTQTAQAASSYEKAVQGIEAVDTLIAKLPTAITRGLQIGAVSFNPKLMTEEARAQLNHDISALAAKYRGTANKGTLRMEAVLQTRYTQQIDEARATTQAHYKEAPVDDLYAEASELIQDINENTAMDQRKTILRGQQAGTVASVTDSTSRAKLSTPYGDIHSPVTHDSHSYSSSTSRIAMSSEAAIPGADYTLLLSDARFPSTATNAKRQLTPFEARLVLEKAVKVFEIQQALVSRDARLAGLLRTWVDQSIFTVRAPEAVTRRNAYGRSTTQIEYANSEILGSAIKADLAKYGNRSFFEKSRADSFGSKIDENRASDLK